MYSGYGRCYPPPCCPPPCMPCDPCLPHHPPKKCGPEITFSGPGGLVGISDATPVDAGVSLTTTSHNRLGMVTVELSNSANTQTDVIIDIVLNPSTTVISYKQTLPAVTSGSFTETVTVQGLLAAAGTYSVKITGAAGITVNKARFTSL